MERLTDEKLTALIREGMVDERVVALIGPEENTFEEGVACQIGPYDFILETGRQHNDPAQYRAELGDETIVSEICATLQQMYDESEDAREDYILFVHCLEHGW